MSGLTAACQEIHTCKKSSDKISIVYIGRYLGADSLGVLGCKLKSNYHAAFLALMKHKNVN